MRRQRPEHGCRILPDPAAVRLFKTDDCGRSLVLGGSARSDACSRGLTSSLLWTCYDADLARRMTAVLEKKRAAAHQVTLEEVDSRSLPCRLRERRWRDY